MKQPRIFLWLVSIASPRVVPGFGAELEAGPFLRIFSEGQLRKGTSGRKEKVERYSLLGGLGFLSSLDLISYNFSMIFAHFQTKRDITRGRGQNPSGGGGGIRAGGGALAPPVCVLKKALTGGL